MTVDDNGNMEGSQERQGLLSAQDEKDTVLSHHYRLWLPSSPSQSSFRVLALLFYEELGNAKVSSVLSHLPPWVKQEIPNDNADDDNNNVEEQKSRTFIVGTNDEPGFMGGAICAERAAMVQLRFVPKFRITKLVIATDSLQPIAPGMLCREFLAGHPSVPWDLPVISTACECTRCHLRDSALFLPSEAGPAMRNSVSLPPCIDGHARHSIPTLNTTIADLYPYPSPYTRLTASESVALGESYSESAESTRLLESLDEKAKRLLEVAILEAKRNVSRNHPIQFGAAVLLEDESIVTSYQSSALEYGCTLDAVSQLAPYLKDEGSAPVMLVQADQYGIAHAPFAPARSFLSEHGFEDCRVLLHATPSLNDVADCLHEWKLTEVRAGDLAPDAPAWTTSVEDENDVSANDNDEQSLSATGSLREPTSENQDETERGRNSKKNNGATTGRGNSDPNEDSIGVLSTSIHEERPQIVISKLKSISADLVNKYNESQGSLSELSLAVNDSAKGLTFDEVYEQQEVLGEGGFAFVYRCQHKQRGTTYAVKEVFNENYETSGEDVKEEIQSMKRLREIPYIVKLFDVFTGPDRTHLIMEEMRGGDLLEKLYEKETFTERESRTITRRLLEAIFFCHKKRIAHRDVKPENILLVDPNDDTKIKLGDFGTAHPITGPNCLHTLVGSPQYVAPEIYLHEDGYDERCDLWSAGVVIFVILGGYAPFEAATADLPRIICEGFFKFEEKEWKNVSEEPKQFIKSLLVVNPEERATAEGALDSEWLRRKDRESIKRYSGHNPDGSSTRTFEAWVKLQNESAHSKSKNGKIDILDFANDCLEKEGTGMNGNESTRSFYVDDL